MSDPYVCVVFRAPVADAWGSDVGAKRKRAPRSLALPGPGYDGDLLAGATSRNT